MTKVTSQKIEIQKEEIDNDSVVSEETLARIGASINWIIENTSEKVGDILTSALNETQFQNERTNKWVLLDGRDVTGSDYETITGNSTIPDMRGRFPRMKDNGASVDPDGDANIGTNRNDKFKNHSHSIPGPVSATGGNFDSTGTSFFNTANTGSTGSNETAPKQTILNFFIKINN